MSSVNRVQILGRTGKDPEVKTMNNGQMVANFSVATSEEWKDKTTGEKKSQTEWHNIVLWGPVAGVAEKYLKKGDQVYIEGKIKTRSWEKDGVTRYTTEILGDKLVLLGNKGSGGGSSGSKQQQNNQTTYASNEGTDDLPF